MVPLLLGAAGPRSWRATTPAWPPRCRRAGARSPRCGPGARSSSLSPPVDGHCYKVVEAVVPRR